MNNDSPSHYWFFYLLSQLYFLILKNKKNEMKYCQQQKLHFSYFALVDQQSLYS